MTALLRRLVAALGTWAALSLLAATAWMVPREERPIPPRRRVRVAAPQGPRVLPVLYYLPVAECPHPLGDRVLSVEAESEAQAWNVIARGT